VIVGEAGGAEGEVLGPVEVAVLAGEDMTMRSWPKLAPVMCNLAPRITTPSQVRSATWV
jgi:hypothetical protein